MTSSVVVEGFDGIRETMAGVYNRSRLKGRNDYFQLPDWAANPLRAGDHLSRADEEFNHIEISGSAHGPVEIVDEGGNALYKLFDRPAGMERTVNRIEAKTGAKIRVTNELAE